MYKETVSNIIKSSLSVSIVFKNNYFGQIVCSIFAVALTISVNSKASSAFEKMISGIQSQFTVTNGKQYILDGINCHGTSFHMAGIMGYPSHIGKNELNYLLDNYCQKVKEPTKNTIAVWDRYSLFSHSYVHSSPTTIIEKRSLSKNSKVTFLNRKKNQSTSYFQCRRPINKCHNQKIDTLRKNIQLIGYYYASISIGKSDFRFRTKMLDYLNKNLAELKETKPDSSDCRQTKNILLQRTDSLLQWAESINGLGIYTNQLNGSKL